MMKFKELQPFAQIAWIIVGMFVFIVACGIFSDWVGSPSEPRVTASTPTQPSKKVTDPNDPWEAMQRNYDAACESSRRDAVREGWKRYDARESWKRYNALSENDRRQVLEEFVKNQRKVFGK